MPGEPVDQLKALIVGFEEWGGLEPKSLFGLLDKEIQLAKAAALYADEVTLASQVASMALGTLQLAAKLSEREDVDKDFSDFVGELGHKEEKLIEDLVDGLGHEDLHAVGPFESGMVLSKWIYDEIPLPYLPLTRAKTLEATKPDVFHANYVAYLRSPAGKKYLEATESLAESTTKAAQKEMLLGWAKEIREVRSGKSDGISFHLKPAKPSPEGQLAVGILGGLPAFPEADWDVIYDVRDRLLPSRVKFRAAVSEASEELKNCAIDEVELACVALKRQTIAPALAEIEASLEEMEAVPTLLRATQGVPMASAALANLALAASDPAGLGFSALAHGLASAPALAAGLRELSFRRGEKKKLEAKPYWLLHELQKKGTKKKAPGPASPSRRRSRASRRPRLRG